VRASAGKIKLTKMKNQREVRAQQQNNTTYSLVLVPSAPRRPGRDVPPPYCPNRPAWPC